MPVVSEGRTRLPGEIWVLVGAGFLMWALAVYALYRVLRNRLDGSRRFFRILLLAILLPYIANSTGWLMTELGRQPWIVFGLMKTEDAVSKTVAGSSVLVSLILFTAVYGALMVADIYLLRKYAQSDPAQDTASITAY